MAQLFSRYESGLQFTAGDMVGSVLGVSGLNPIIDRLNSITIDNQLITGSLISGTSTTLFISGLNTNGILSGTNLNIIGKYINGNLFTGSLISGTSSKIYSSILNSSTLYSSTVSGITLSGTNIYASTNIISPHQTGNTWTGSLVSGTALKIFGGSMYAGDHSSSGDEDMLVNVCYGTDDTPPSANTTTIGTLYIQYTA